MKTRLLGTSVLLAASGMLALGIVASTGTSAMAMAGETVADQPECTATTISDTGTAQPGTLDSVELAVANDANDADTDTDRNGGNGHDGQERRAGRPVTIWMAGDSTMQNATTCPIGWGSQFGQ